MTGLCGRNSQALLKILRPRTAHGMYPPSHAAEKRLACVVLPTAKNPTQMKHRAQSKEDAVAETAEVPFAIRLIARKNRHRLRLFSAEALVV